MPLQAPLQLCTTVVGLHSRGSGLLMTTEGTLTGADGVVYATTTEGTFLRGAGGGEKLSVGRALASPTIPTTPPSATRRSATSQDQALMFRLSGDYNPLHADPQLAAVGGPCRRHLHHHRRHRHRRRRHRRRRRRRRRHWTHVHGFCRLYTPPRWWDSSAQSSTVFARSALRRATWWRKRARVSRSASFASAADFRARACLVRSSRRRCGTSIREVRWSSAVTGRRVRRAPCAVEEGRWRSWQATQLGRASVRRVAAAVAVAVAVAAAAISMSSSARESSAAGNMPWCLTGGLR